MREYLAKHRLLTISALLFPAIAQGFFLLPPWYGRRFFDALSGGITYDNIATATDAVLMIFVFSMLSWLGWRVAAVSSTYLQTAVIADMAVKMEQYLLRHSHHFFSNNFAGSLVRKLNRYTRSFEGLADHVTFSFIPLAVSVLGISTILTIYKPILGLILVGWIVAFLGLIYIFINWKQKYELEKAAKDSESTGVLSDQVTNSENIRLFSAYNHELRLYKKVILEVRRLTRFNWNLNEIMDAFQGFMMISLNAGMLYVALKLWQKGELTIGDFALIQAYLIDVFNRVWEFGRVLRRTYEYIADATEGVEIMETQHEVSDYSRATKLNVSRGAIDFKRVTFRYNQTRTILENLNLNIPAGQHIALVGPSGAGKSTITKLLLRLYDIESGNISIDDHNIAKVSQDSLRQSIALVPQDPVLFHRTLLENIRYGKKDATIDEVLEAAKAAHCTEFIDNLPEKYDTYVGERGIKLSGGERQRIAIARAILKNAPILILDEATSSLDSESEALIQDALKKLMKNRTALVIAHRLSTIMNMDRILVVDEGGITADGTHNELIKSSETYAKLWEIQAGGFLP
jgi:ATP-binding cassette subfamily B protein